MSLQWTVSNHRYQEASETLDVGSLACLVLSWCVLSVLQSSITVSHAVSVCLSVCPTDLYINKIDTGLASLSIAKCEPLKLTSPAQHASRWRMRAQPNLSSALLVLPAGRMPRWRNTKWHWSLCHEIPERNYPRNACWAGEVSLKGSWIGCQCCPCGLPRAAPLSCRILPIRFLAGWRKRRLNQAFSLVLV